MRKHIIYKSIEWIDLTSPSDLEMHDLSSKYNLDIITVSELLSNSISSKIDINDNYIFIVLTFDANTEIDFVIGKDFIITTHYKYIDQLDSLFKTLSSGDSTFILEKNAENINTGVLFYYMIKKMYQNIEDKTIRLETHLKSVEDKVYTGNEKEMVITLAKIGKDILDASQSIEGHDNIFNIFKTESANISSNSFARYSNALINDYHNILRKINRISATHKELRTTNDSLLSTKQNNIMQVFTIVAFLTFIPSVISSIYGMNVKNLPFADLEYGLWIVLLLIIVVSYLAFAFLRKKHWL